ncbi:MAG: four-helix bundle copper-binding protein [Bacteroidales bacterium]|nr:four-helix bundle copper-binding protein [Bacteroidales bacterium]
MLFPCCVHQALTLCIQACFEC